MHSDAKDSPGAGSVADLDSARTLADLRRQLAEKTAEVDRLRAELQRHAVTDEMTNLANRKGFYILAEHALRHAARRGLPCVVVKVDIDGLADVNRRLGHEHGDALVGDFATMLREMFRASDVVARVDGDEFCVLVQDPGDDAQVIRRRIEERAATVSQRLGKPYTLALHLGIASTDPDSPGTLDELLARADRALYADKHARPPSRKRNAA